MQPAGQLVVASDIRNTLFRRALTLLDEVHAGLEDFSFGELHQSAIDSSVASPGKSTAIVPSEPENFHGAALVPHQGADPLERVLATFVQGRTATARRAVGAVAQIHNEIDSILSSFERDFPPVPEGSAERSQQQDVSFKGVTVAQPSEEVLRMAAATTAAAARFRVRAAEAAKAALQVYDKAAKQASMAAQATTQALEMQILAEQHSAAGNLPQALDAIRQANRLRDDSAEAARISRKLQQEYMRHRREAQEAHMQADAAMRHAYKLEREALKSSTEAAERQHAMWKDRYERLAHQAEDLRAQAATLDAEADAAVARAQEAQHQADEEMAAGNYDTSNALMQEAVRSQEKAGYTRAQAAAAREALQRLMPDLQAARDRMEETERDMEELSERQRRLQDATTKQRTDRLQEEAEELAALCTAAEAAAAMHEDLVNVYEERLAQDRQQYERLSNEGRLAEADALAVHINTWEELLHVARKNLDASRTEAAAMHARLLDLSKADVSKDPAAELEGNEDFQQLRGAKNKEALASQAVAILARGLATAALQDATVEGSGGGSDGLLLQTEMHRQRIARLAQQMDTERKRLEDGSAFLSADGQPVSAQAEALLDSMAVSHLVGTLETTRLLQLWKQRSDQAAASADELRKRWTALEQDASAKADEAVRLEEQALALEQAGNPEEAASTMAQAEQLHRMAEQLRLEADRAKAALIARETAADNAQAQTRSLVQGLYDVEHAAERLQSELGLHGFNSGDQLTPAVPTVEGDPSVPGSSGVQRAGGFTLSAPTNDEMSTVMMASPGMLSRSSSAAAAHGFLTSSVDMAAQQMPSFAGHAGFAEDDGLATKPPRGFAAGALTHADERQAEQRVTASAEPWLLTQASSVQGPDTISNKDDIHLHETRLARLIQELELHVTVGAPSIPTHRWDGHAALVSALQSAGDIGDGVLAVGNSLATLQERVRDCAGVLEAQVQEDEQRNIRLQELVAALPAGLDSCMSQVANQASYRCAVVAAASKVAGDALVLQAKCHGALASGLNEYRRALASQRMVEDLAKSAQAEAVSLQGQAQHAQALDSDLSQQVQAVKEQLDAFESHGSTAQALATRYELQRLQNKHEAAAAQSSQVQLAFKAAQQRAHEAKQKESGAGANLQNLSRAVITLANAANEATAGAEHALAGYSHAVSALVLGARADLSRLGAGDAGIASSPSVDIEVQSHLQMHAHQLTQAEQRLEATRRLQQVVDTGQHLLSPAVSGTWRASNIPSADGGQPEGSGMLTGRSSYASAPTRTDAPQVQRMLGGAIYLGTGPSAQSEQKMPFDSGRVSEEANGERSVLGVLSLLGTPPSLNDPSGVNNSLGVQQGMHGGLPAAAGGRRPSKSEPVEQSALGSYRFLGLGTPSNADDQPLQAASSRQFGLYPMEQPALGAYSSLDGSYGEHRATDGRDQLSGSARSEAPVLGSYAFLGIQPSMHGSGGGGLSAAPPGPPIWLSSTTSQAASELSGPLNRAAEGAERTNLVSLSSGDSSSSDRAASARSTLIALPGREAFTTGKPGGAETAPERLTCQETAPHMPRWVPHVTPSADAASGRVGTTAEVPGMAALTSTTASSTVGLGGAASSAGPAGSLLSALGGLKLQGVNLFPEGKPQSYQEPTPITNDELPASQGSTTDQGPFGSLQAILSGSKSLATPQSGQVVQVVEKSANGRAVSTGGIPSVPAEQQYESEASGPRPTRPAIVALPPRAPKVANNDASSGVGSFGTSRQSNPDGIPANPASPRQRPGGHATERNVEAEPGGFGTLQHLFGGTPATAISGISEQQSCGLNTAEGLGLSRGPMAVPAPGRTEPILHGTTDRTTSGHPSLPATAAGQRVAPFADAIRTIEADLVRLLAHHQQQRNQLQTQTEEAAWESGRPPTRVELEAQLRQAEAHLRAAKAEQEQLENASPAQVQTYHDKLQYHEHQVAMLRQALDVCSELDDSTTSMKRTREEMRMVDLETQQCEEALLLLAKAADMCSAAAREMQLQESDPLVAIGVQSSLAKLQEKASDFTQRQQQARREADRLHERRQQLEEQFAAQQAAVRLREELVQQARKAAAAASDTLAWDARLMEARTELRRLEAPLLEMQEKAQAASEAAQTMTMAAAQHRKQAAELAQQAARQREDVRRFAASDQQLEAEAAKSMADSLQQQADGLLAQATRMEKDARKLKSEAQELELSADRAHNRIAAQAEVVNQVTKAHQLSVTSLQLNRTAASKLQDALHKQTVAAEQQLALTKVVQELAVMESQMTGSGAGSVVRPDELASHMINVVRAKQEVSRMRAALQATRQQQDQDHDSASAAVRQAVKVEGERTHLESRIAELELQVHAIAPVVGSPSGARGENVPYDDGKLLTMGPELIFGSAIGTRSFDRTSTPADPDATDAGSARIVVSSDDAQRQRANNSPFAGEAAGGQQRVPFLLQSARNATEQDSAADDTRAGVFTGHRSGAIPAAGRVQLLVGASAAVAVDAVDEYRSQSPNVRRVELVVPRTETVKQVTETRCSPADEPDREQLGKRTYATTMSQSIDRGRGDTVAADSDGAAPSKRFLIGAATAVGVVTASAPNGAGAVATVPSARVMLGSNQTQVPISGVSSPAASVAGAAMGARLDWSPRRKTSARLSVASTRQGVMYDGQDGDFSDRTESRASSPSVLGQPRMARMETSPRLVRAETSPRPVRMESPPRMVGAETSPRMVRMEAFPRTVRAETSPHMARLDAFPHIQREESSMSFSPSFGLMRFAPRSPDRPSREDAGTAGDLMDKVANKSLRPLSHVKITDAAGKPVLQPYQQRDSTTSFDSGARGTSASGTERRPGGRAVSTDGRSDGDASNPTRTSFEEEELAEDTAAEPDTKMYRTMRQRVVDLDNRIGQLRRQGDTARTAAEILGQKQEQRRADMSNAVEDDEALQIAIFDHGDAMIRMKEAEAVSCHKQADLLDEEVAACREAVQYAVVDWHSRREVKRLEERCAALAERAQRQVNEAEAVDADIADATECITLATAKAGRGNRSFPATLEQQHMARFIDEQHARLAAARQRAAENRLEAAKLAGVAREAVARKLLAEKKALCNKALYQSAVELADSFDHAAKIIAQIQQVRHVGLKSVADALAERVQQLEAEAEAQANGAKPSADANKLKSSRTLNSQPSRQNEKVLQVIGRMSVEVEDALKQCLKEIMDDSSDVLRVHRRRMEQITALVRLYQVSYDCHDHLAEEVEASRAAVASVKPQPLSEAARRSAQVTAAQEAIRDLDRACELASELRALALNASTVHVSLFELRTEPNTVRSQLLGQKPSAHDPYREELNSYKQRLTILDIEIPLARDQMSAALQVLEYRQAAAQLAEAQRDLQYAASVASEAIIGLESTVAVHRENVSMVHRHMNAVLHEAHVFTANGNILQAAAAEEAAQSLAKEALAAESTLQGFAQDLQLKRDERTLAGAAADELQQVADGSLELVGLLLRIVQLQQEARVVSRRISDLDGEQARLEQESQAQKSLAEHASKQAELIQHESLQCRTDLKFSAADAHLNESRQYRASAQEHMNAAEAAQQAAAATAVQHQSLCQRRRQLLREVHLLHTAANHLQGALSCMRDKHHLVRKLRDVEYHRQHSQQPAECERSPSPGRVAEADVLQTQVEASIATVKHHLASKTSYVTAADNLHLAEASQGREGSCASQADAAMQDIMKARLASVTSGARSSVPLLTDGRASNPGGMQVLPSSSALALIRHGQSEESVGPLRAGANWQLQQAELRYRCLRGSLPVLKAIAAAAERASEARCKQVDLSDQAAVLVSNLAAKILEAEACANEAASLEAAVQMNAALLDEDDEENLKAKLMLNALLQRAESFRNEALLLQGRIKELEEQERIAGNRANDMEASLSRLQADHSHTLAALDLAERISQNREQETALRAQAQALAAEVTQLDREARSMESKTAQLRQQLTNASHTACSEDVANLMLVMQQIDGKLALHRQTLQQRKVELEANHPDCERLSTEIVQMMQRTEHVLHAGETQEQVRQTTTRVGELQAELASAESASAQCERMLSELRQQYEQLASSALGSLDMSEAETPASLMKARQTQQVASTQAAIAIAEQMLETHVQRVAVLQAAVAAWEAAKQRQEALLRHQEQLMQQDGWRATLEQHRAKLRKAAVAHAERAKELRAGADSVSNGAATLLIAGSERSSRASQGGDMVGSVLSQAATIRSATKVAEQHARAEAEDALAARAASLAHDIDREIKYMAVASDLVRPMYERLYGVVNASMSVARLQLVCVGVCAEQGVELSSMHDALSAVRDLAGKIQGLLDAADRNARAGHSMKAAAARGEATAVQDALQHELKTVRMCRQRLTGLSTKMQEAAQELSLADKRMAQVVRSAPATQSVAEYIHRAYELHYDCGERQWSGLQLLRQAADAAERTAAARREHEASQEAEKQLVQAGKTDSAAAVGRMTATLKRSITEAEAERRLLDAQVVQEINACGSGAAAARMYMDLARITIKLLRHMDELQSHQEEHEQLHTSLEAARRSHHSAHTLLVHRRAEMQSLTGQIEANRLESQLLRKMGNDAQAVVRQDAANMLTGQLAEIAEDVMKLETRCESMEQRLALMSSLYAKSEARMGLFNHLARLSSASIGHLLDARDAHDSHASHTREAAVAAVELSTQEAALSEAEDRIRELRESMAHLSADQQSADKDQTDDSDGVPDKLQRGIGLAQAELMLAHRRRAEAERQMLITRSRVAQAELAAQSCQLRITKARQRAEDAQKLVDDVHTLLQGSTALTISFDFATSSGGDGGGSTDAGSSSEAQSAATSHAGILHGDMAAAQLHSVTLQALTEAASKFIDALDCAAAAEQKRSKMLSATQAAQAAREAAARQEVAATELSTVAEGINVAKHVHALRGKSIRRRMGGLGIDDGTRRPDPFGPQVGRQAMTSASPTGAASAEQDAAAVAALELERLQHEAAYLDAKGAQESKLAVCLIQQQGVLRLASESLLNMARFGLAAELKAGSNMSADEAASLLDACKHLAEQHGATLLLLPALDCCKQAEDCLRASVDCVESAKSLRSKAIDDRLAALQDGNAAALEATSALQSAVTSSRSPLEAGFRSQTFPPLRDPAADMEVKAAARLAACRQVLAEEEQMLTEVQELEKRATLLLEESDSHTRAFAARWAEVTRPLCAEHRHGRTKQAGVKGSQNATRESTRPQTQLTPEVDFPDDLQSVVDAPLDSGTAHPAPGLESSVGALSLSLLEGMGGSEGRHGNRHNVPSSPQRPSPPFGIHFEEDDVLPLREAPPKEQVCSTRSADIDVDLVAMAAATVARAKAAAAALAVKAATALDDRHSSYGQQADKASRAPCSDASEYDSRRGAVMRHVQSDRAAQLLARNLSAEAAGQGPFNLIECDLGKAVTADGTVTFTATGLKPVVQQGGKQAATLHAVALRKDVQSGDRRLEDTLKRAAARRQVPIDNTSDALQRPERDTPLKRSVEAAAARATLARPLPDPATAGPTEERMALPRIPLPDELDSETAGAIQSLWSNAALHYERAQHMHECSLQQTERQWQRCQAQIQMLRAEELKAQSAGRLSEADAVSTALAKWQQRAGHLEAAMRRHRAEYVHLKALVHRATVVVERLQLAAGPAPYRPGLSLQQKEQDSAVLQRLLPKLPASMLAGCGVLQSLERLHGELVQQVAALHAAVAGLQQRSQRMFSKASRRSNKLKVRLGAIDDSAAHAVAIAKSQSVAEQSAALGERAVELAAQARTMQELAEQLSSEGTLCSQLLERLQRASELELQAQQALVQAADLVLAEAMQAVHRGERGQGVGSVTAGRLKHDHSRSDPCLQSEAPIGDLDALLQGYHPPGACLAAALKQVRRGEDLAQEAARAVQSSKEQLESSMGPYLRRMEDAATAMAGLASAHSAHSDSLRAQVDAAALCVARAHTKAAAQRAERDTAAAAKYNRAAEGWSKQVEKLRKEAMAASAAAEEMGTRGHALASLGARLRPIQEVLDGYLDEQLEAWASAALARIQPEDS